MIRFLWACFDAVLTAAVTIAFALAVNKYTDYREKKKRDQAHR